MVVQYLSTPNPEQASNLSSVCVCRDWHLVQTRIRDHPDFGLYFVEYPEDTTWMEADLFDGDTDSRIPFDVLRLPEAETVYKNHLNQLHAHQQRLE